VQSSDGRKLAKTNAYSSLPIDIRPAVRHIIALLPWQLLQWKQAAFRGSPTRRGVLEQLGRADASITDLAENFHMTLTGMKKHVGVLEQAGLVSTEKVGRVRTCRLGLRGLDKEAEWIERYRQLWAERFDELDEIVEELKQKEKPHGQKKR
jgi:DNA-binding transcriptional ArsR family regulator